MQDFNDSRCRVGFCVNIKIRGGEGIGLHVKLMQDFHQQQLDTARTGLRSHMLGEALDQD